MLKSLPRTKKEIDAVVFKRVVKRLISDDVQPQDLRKRIAQARALFKEVVEEAFYDKTYMANPALPASVEKELENDMHETLREMSFEQMNQYRAGQL